jgi:hypothetical protein
MTTEMVKTHGKFGGDIIQNGGHRSNQIPSPGKVNLLMLVLRFLCKGRLPIIMPLLAFFHRFTKLLVHNTIG